MAAPEAELASAGELRAEAQAVAAQADGPEPTSEAVAWEDAHTVQEAIAELLTATELSNCSVRKFRRQVASHLGLGKKGLETKAELVNAMIKDSVQKVSKQPETPAQRMAKIVEDLGAEKPGAKQFVYFGTLSRLLPETLAADDHKDITGMDREAIGECVRKAFDDPLPPAAKAAALEQEITAMGAVHVQELAAEDLEDSEVLVNAQAV